MCVVFLLLLVSLAGADFYSVTSGYWLDPLTWGESNIPDISDNVYIQSGHVIYLDGITSLTVNSLFISSHNALPASLIGPYGTGCSVFVTEDINLVNAGSQASLLPGELGNIYVQLGEDLVITGDCIYDVERTTFTANSPDVTDNKGQLTLVGNPQVYTIFDTLASDDIIEVTNNVILPEGINYGFENAKLEMGLYVGFTNSYFINCTFMVQENMLSNCHLYSCSADNTMYFNGPVAMMDNNNIFHNLILLDGGSLWGNYGTNSTVEISNNLTTYNNSLLCPGSMGALDVYLGGDFSLDGQFYPTHLYFNGARTDSDPQELRRDFHADITGTFINLNSTLILTTVFQFNTYGSFYPGRLFLNGQQIINAYVSGAIVPDNGGLADCNISFCLFYAPVHLWRCTLMDNDNICYSHLTVSLALNGAYGTNTLLRVMGDMYMQGSSSLNPGEFGNITVELGGNLVNYGSLNTSSFKFVGVDAQDVSFNQEAIFNTDIYFSTPRLVFSPIDSAFLDLNYHTISCAAGSIMNTNQVLSLHNAYLQELVVDEGSPISSGQLLLTDCYLNGSTFNLPVSIEGDCYLLPLSNYFTEPLQINADLIGYYGIGIQLFATDLNMDSGNLAPGQFGSLDVHLTGNLTATSYGTMPALFNASNVYLDSPSDQYLTALGVTINSSIIVTNTQEIYLGSDFLFPVSREKHIISYAEPPTVFYLDNYTLGNAILDGGHYRSGLLTDVTLYGVKGQDLTLGGNVNLGDNGNVFYGNIDNQAWLLGAYNTNSQFTSYGPFRNYNFVQAGQWGTMDAYLYGDVYDDSGYSGNWEGYLHLRGTEPRNIDFSENLAVVIADNNADFALTGINVLHGLIIEAGSTVTVSPGAALNMITLGGWFSGNLVMNGTFTNARNLLATDVYFHDFTFTPDQVIGEWGNMTVSHSISEPLNLPNSTGEFWVSTLTGNYTVVNGSLALHYRGSNVTDLRAFYSLDDGATWIPFLGDVFNDIDNKIITIPSVTFSQYMYFAISSVYDGWYNSLGFTPDNLNPSPINPHFNWPDIVGATAYRIEISNNDWASVCYYGDVVAESECDIAYALAPATSYRWKVYATSSVLGDIVSLDTYNFHTRNAITSTLPATSAYLPGDPIAFYLPVFLQNLLPGELIEVTAYSSAHLQAAYLDGILTVTPDLGWTGSETIELQIGDGFTLLNPSINIVVLGTPGNISLSIAEIEGYLYDQFSWDAVPGASYYMIYAADDPSGPWIACGWSSQNNMSLEHQGMMKFYSIKANTGALPRHSEE